MKNKQHVIIMEGVDRTGKTQIGKALAKELNIPYFKHSNEHKFYKREKFSFEDATFYQGEYLADFLKQTNQSVVLDRFYPSEYVYSQIVAHRNTNYSMLRQIDDMFAELNTKIIILDKQGHKLKEEWNEEDLIPWNKAKKVRKLYDDFREFTACKTRKLDTTDHNLQRQVKELTQFTAGRMPKTRIKDEKLQPKK